MTRIIIADPDPATRKALNLLLLRKMRTNDIAQVGDVETLIRTLAGETPELLLLDWRLYGSPAPETCQLLRKAYPNLNIILLSVNADDETAARKAGADFIHKGASPEDVIAKLTPFFKKDSE